MTQSPFYSQLMNADNMSMLQKAWAKYQGLFDKWEKSVSNYEDAYQRSVTDVQSQARSAVGSGKAGLVGRGLLGTTATGQMARNVAATTAQELTGLAQERSDFLYDAYLSKSELEAHNWTKNLGGGAFSGLVGNQAWKLHQQGKIQGSTPDWQSLFADWGKTNSVGLKYTGD